MIQALSVRITKASGETLVIDQPSECLYVRTCPYCDKEFSTEDPRKRFCKRTHAKMYHRKHAG